MATTKTFVVLIPGQPRLEISATDMRAGANLVIFNDGIQDVAAIVTPPGTVISVKEVIKQSV